MATSGNNDESEQHQVVVDTIRERIRSQALDLLDRVESRRPSSNGGGSSPSTSSSSHSSRSSLLHREHDDEEKKDDCNNYDGIGMMRGHDDGTYGDETSNNNKKPSLYVHTDDDSTPPLSPLGGTSSCRSSTSSSGSRRGSSSSSKSALTHRLQQLALSRQGLQDQRQRLRIVQADSTSHLSSCKSFQELELPEYLLKAVFEMGLDRPSAIQEAALPRILRGRNLIGQAQSGSGKTAAFALGMLYHCQVDTTAPTATTQGLVLCPTRELAIQVVEQALKPMSVYMEGIKIKLAISGEQQKKGSDIDAHILVATPGKVVDWLKKRIINPQTIRCCVMDEADAMVEEGGFRANSLLVKKHLPRTCQYLLFSATFPPAVVEFASKIVGPSADKILIENDETLVVDVIKQLWIDCRQYPGGKIMFLADIYNLMTIGQSIIFVETRAEADLVHSTLSQGGYTCSVLHSCIEPEDRDSTMEEFRRGRTTVLITTNVLARGVDVDNVCLVIQCHIQVNRDGQPDYETYLHRIGRTGRFGRKGTALALISDDTNADSLKQIEHRFGSSTASGNGQRMIQQAEADPETLADVTEI